MFASNLTMSFLGSVLKASPPTSAVPSSPIRDPATPATCKAASTASSPPLFPSSSCLRRRRETESFRALLSSGSLSVRSLTVLARVLPLTSSATVALPPLMGVSKVCTSFRSPASMTPVDNKESRFSRMNSGVASAPGYTCRLPSTSVTATSGVSLRSRAAIRASRTSLTSPTISATKGSISGRPAGFTCFMAKYLRSVSALAFCWANSGLLRSKSKL